MSRRLVGERDVFAPGHGGSPLLPSFDTGERTARIASRAGSRAREERMSSHPAAANQSDQAGYRIEASPHSAGREILRRISEALGSDHERLASLEVAAFVARAAGDAKAAERWYAAFSS